MAEMIELNMKFTITIVLPSTLIVLWEILVGGGAIVTTSFKKENTLATK